MHFAAVLFLTLLLPLSVTAEERQFADIIYTPLADWDPGREEDGTKVFFSELPDDRCDICRFYLSASTPHRGSLASFIDANLTRFEDPDDRDRFQSIGPPDTTTIAGYPARIEGYNFGSRTLYIFFAVDLGDRKSLLAFRGNYYDADELREISDVVVNQIAPFFDELRFISNADDLLLPAAKAGNMSGVWWGWRQRVLPGIDGLIKITIQHDVLVFYPDGHVYHGAPPSGVTRMDRDAVAGTFDENLGVYAHQGSRRIAITYLDGRTEELNWDRAARAWTDGRIEYMQVAPVPDGTMLQGGLSSFSYTGFTPGSGIDGGVASSSNTTFAQDGTFTGESFGSVSASFAGGGVTSSNTRDQRGTYEIRDGLIIMTDQSGETRAEIIFETGDGILIGDKFLETE